MSHSMYLFVYGLRSEPVAMPLLSYSFSTSYNSMQKPDPTKKIDDRDRNSKTWDVEAVASWLERKNLKEFVSSFREHRVDGRVLQALVEKDLDILAPSVALGPRKRFMSDFYDLLTLTDDDERKEREKNERLSVSSISCTLYEGALTLLASVAPLLQARTLPHVQIIQYSAGRPNRYDPDAKTLPRGTVIQIMDLWDATVSYMSTGGSNGENRLTNNCAFSAKKYAFSMGSKGALALSDEHKARIIGIAPEAFAALEDKESFGVTITYDTNTLKTVVEEWGKPGSGPSPFTTCPELPAEQDREARCQEVAKENVCTFTVTGRKFTQQDWRACFTCWPPGENHGVCMGCVERCHAGHDLQEVRNDRFFCDCGCGDAPNPCQSLKPGPVPPKKETDDDKPITLGDDE